MKAFLSTLLILSTCIHLFSQTSFEQHGIDPEHTAVSGIAAVDYDQDNDIDIIANHRILNKVIIWENDGSIPANWSMKLLTDQIIEPMYIYSRDINGDNLPDLLISAASSNALYCFMNIDGENNWDIFVMDDAFSSAHGVCIEDIDGDDMPDIMATAAADNTIALWTNNGDDPDTWPKTIISDQMNGSQTVTAADINDDGFMDIVGAASDLNKVVVYYNNGDSPPTFSEQLACQTLLLPHWVSVADIDNDGNKDILVAACSSGRIAWLQNSGDSLIQWTQRTIGSNFGCALTVEAADFDKDGDLDVAATAYGSNNFAWWEHSGSGNQISWELHMLSGNYLGAWPLVISDIEGDTDMDILTGGDLLNGLGNESPLSVWENKLLSTSVGKRYNDIHNSINVWPQPASDRLTISYSLLEDTYVSLAIYNSQGVMVGDVVSEFQPEGNHQADICLSPANDDYTAGLYVCRLIANKNVLTKKILLVDH